MAHTHEEAHHADLTAFGHEEHGNVVPAFMAVFVALCVFTAVSFGVHYLVNQKSLSVMAGFGIILCVAFVKAFLVVTYFMHLKWDWNRLYFLIIPVCILAPMLVFALLPDIVIYWKNFHMSPEAPAAVAAP